jgi:hypothetical protein
VPAYTWCESVLSHGFRSQDNSGQHDPPLGRARPDRLVFQSWAIDLGETALRV